MAGISDEVEALTKAVRSQQKSISELRGAIDNMGGQIHALGGMVQGLLEQNAALVEAFLAEEDELPETGNGDLSVAESDDT